MLAAGVVVLFIAALAYSFAKCAKATDKQAKIRRNNFRTESPNSSCRSSLSFLPVPPSQRLLDFEISNNEVAARTTTSGFQVRDIGALHAEAFRHRPCAHCADRDGA